MYWVDANTVTGLGHGDLSRWMMRAYGALLFRLEELAPTPRPKYVVAGKRLAIHGPRPRSCARPERLGYQRPQEMRVCTGSTEGSDSTGDPRVTLFFADSALRTAKNLWALVTIC